MAARRVRTYGGGLSPAVADMLQIALAIELLSPSRRVWLVSPWVADLPVLDNRGGAFMAVGPGWPLRYVTLIEVIEVLLARGSTLTVVTRDEPSNAYFCSQMRQLEETYPSRCRLLIDPQVHEKGVVTDHAFLTGSMNYTFSGQSTNRELLTLETDAASVNQAQLELAGRYPWEAVTDE